VDDGKENRERYDWRGNKITPPWFRVFCSFRPEEFWNNHKGAIITVGVVAVVGTAIISTGAAAAAGAPALAF